MIVTDWRRASDDSDGHPDAEDLRPMLRPEIEELLIRRGRKHYREARSAKERGGGGGGGGVDEQRIEASMREPSGGHVAHPPDAPACPSSRLGAARVGGRTSASELDCCLARTLGSC